MLEQMLPALAVLADPYAIMLLLVGAFVGLICGVIPGLSSTTACILMLPLTYSMSFSHAMVLLVSAAAAGTVGGSVTSILLGVPGAGVNAATVFDGFPMARQGRGVEAVACAASSSALGGIFGIMVLLCMLPVMRSAVLAFGPGEFLMLSLWGLVVIGSVAGKSMLTGIIAAIMGLMMSYVGFNPVIGGMRFTFGIPYLWDGLPLGPVFIGLFAIATALELAVAGEAIVEEGITLKNSWSETRKGLLAPFKYFGVFIRGSIIGTIIGIVPGVGGVVASFLAYGQTVQFAKDKSQFGLGDIRGVIAPESANNAKDGGSLVPTIAFGIPGSEVTAILLGAFMIHGIVPGPDMLGVRMSETWLIILVLAIGTLIGSPMAIVLSRALVNVTKLHPSYVAPIIFLVGLVGSYSFNRNIFDLVTALGTGLFGYACIRLKIPRAPVIIAYILGGLTERYYYQCVQIGRGSFFTYLQSRPIAVVLFVVVFMTALLPIFAKIRQNNKETGA